ncbi:5791_t:CDS:2, partial [Racocetra persica]
MFSTGRPSANKLQQYYIQKTGKSNSGGPTPIELDYASSSSNNYTKNKQKLTNVEDETNQPSQTITNNSLELTQEFVTRNKLITKTNTSLTVELADGRKATTNKIVDITKLELGPYHTSRIFAQKEYLDFPQLAKVPDNEEIFTEYITAECDKNTSSNTSEVQKVLQDFADIFSKTLLNQLPSEQKVDYSIDLIFGEDIVSEPKQQARVKHYELKDKKFFLKEEVRMAILSNKELRIQLLQENHN